MQKACLEEVFELVEVEVDSRLVVSRPHSALLRRSDLVPVQLLQPPPLLRARLHLRVPDTLTLQLASFTEI